MDTTDNQTAEKIFCDACYVKVDSNDQFCNECGYPLKGTKEEQNVFKARQAVNSIDIVDYNKKLRQAANTLYYLSGIFVLSGIIQFFVNKDDPAVLAYVLPSIILAIVFLALAGYTKKKPLACIICGFSLYVIVQILNAIADPKTIASGILIKIIIIGFLIKGIKSAIEIDRIKKESNLV